MRPPFRKILIANRGEIALRILRSARDLGMQVVTVFSEEDRNAPHVLRADEAYHLKGSTLAETYLNIDLMIRIAMEAGCEAIHPGYGFLSESSAFARAVEEAGITFAGPSAETLLLMGNKVRARHWVSELGIPVIPGISGNDPGELIKKSNTLHLPFLVKASEGGGGKGMKLVYHKKDLAAAISTTMQEAKAYFGNGEVYIEELITRGRHIEVQILADRSGQVSILGDRECSIQRRHQKIIEESPAVSIRDRVRKQMYEAARTIARAGGYINAGTVEFLVAGDDSFYFLEMNTRLQVEHPVTEAVTGIDLVREQFLIAAGRKLRQEIIDPTPGGHAIEARIYAEKPESGFLPATGKIHCIRYPSGQDIRTDTAIEGPATVHPHFDPMICKIIASGEDRAKSIQNLTAALKETAFHGIETNLEFLQSLLTDKNFMENKIHTQYIEQHLKDLTENTGSFDRDKGYLFVLAFALFTLKHKMVKERATSPAGIWKKAGRWSNVSTPVIFSVGKHQYEIVFRQGTQPDLALISVTGDPVRQIDYTVKDHEVYFVHEEVQVKGFVTVDSDNKGWVTIEGQTLCVTRSDFLSGVVRHRVRPTRNGNEVLTAPMTGKIISIRVKEAEKVVKGQPLAVIEAMKMQNTIISPDSGIVKQVWGRPGKLIRGNEPVLEIEIQQQ